MRILVITDVLWRDDNGVGNSYSNIFKGMDNVEISNICCQEGQSNNSISVSCFQISESRLIANFRNSSIPTGVIEDKKSVVKNMRASESTLIRSLKRSRLQILFWIRNLIWKIGRWKSQELDAFIDSVKPDLIFAQLQDKIYLNNLVSYVQEYAGCPLVLYAWDDVYSLKQFSVSPLFWIDRFVQRSSIHKLIKQCSKLYTISIEQEQEYAKSLNVDTGLLYKGHNFQIYPGCASGKDKVIKILYTGNLYSGRFETLLEICKEVDRLNNGMRIVQLDIYSGTDLTEKQKKQLNVGNSTFFMGSVSEREVEILQEKADVLLHIEPFTLRGSLLCRLSFSTKLVDYFYKAKPVLAVGSNRCASIQYLQRNDAALVATSMNEAKEKLKVMIESKNAMKEYSKKSWDCGKRNHQIRIIQSKLYADFDNIIQGSSNEYFVDCQ